MDTLQLTERARVQSLLSELDWCIENGHAGPRTAQAIEQARTALAALAPSDMEEASLPGRYFVYDPENGLDTFDTDAQREKAHAEAIEPYLDDGWSEEVENVVSGVITHITLKTTIATNPGHTNCACNECKDYYEAGGTGEWSEICNYHAAPVAPAAVAPTTDEQIIERCKAAGIKWIPPESPDDVDYENGFPGSFDMVSMDEMRALLAAHPTVAPEAWRLVPVKATDAMLIALLSGGEADALAGCKDGYVASRLLQASGVAERYSAMLNAAPTPTVAADAAAPFQTRVQPWMMECFGAAISADRVERNHRFFEEATELVQACGMTASEAHPLVDYTFGRPVGEPAQEVGGVMVTLAALCLANSLDMHAAGETELARISVPETVAKIRAKQAAKPKHSPLPEAAMQADQQVAKWINRYGSLNTRHATEPMSDAARDVLAERARQIAVEGWTPAHDDKYRDHEMSCAAGCYAMHTLAYPAGDPPPAWPWAADWWKPTTPRRDLVKAGALVLAEIERIDRSGDAQKSELRT